MDLVLSAKKVVEQLHLNNVTHVVWLPDSETNFMYDQLTQDSSIEIVSVSREGETMPIAAGLWAGGKRPVVMIQNTGLFESGDSIRGMTIDIQFPLVIFVGYTNKVFPSIVIMKFASHSRLLFRFLNILPIPPFLYVPIGNISRRLSNE